MWFDGFKGDLHMGFIGGMEVSGSSPGMIVNAAQLEDASKLLKMPQKGSYVR